MSWKAARIRNMSDRRFITAARWIRQTRGRSGWRKRGAPNGTLTTAETQTAGKGRRGRVWKSPEGTSVSMSILLYPDLEPAKAPMLTIVMGLAVVQGVQRALGVDTKIKWPNDAVLNGKKLCGILTEMSAQIDYINYVVIGTGINVNQMEFPEEIAEIATSLAIETGHPVNRAKVVAAVLEAFEENYEKFLEAGRSLRRCRKRMRLCLQTKTSRCVYSIRRNRSRVLHLASRRPVSCACKKRTERSLRCIPARFRCEAYTATYRGNGKGRERKNYVFR